MGYHDHRWGFLWRHVIIGFGGLYASVGTVRGLIHLAGGTPLLAVLTKCLLVGIPGLVLAYGGYRLPRTDIHTDLYAEIGRWCLTGIGVLLGIVAAYMYFHSSSSAHLLESSLIFTSIGGLSGFGVGLHAARDKTRLRTVEQYSQTVDCQNDRLEKQNARLESFAGMLAHELRNPLQIAQIYQQQAHSRDDEAAEQVEHALDRIDEMIEVLLVLVQGEDADIDTEPITLSEMASAAWVEVVEAAPTAEADLVVATDHVIGANPVHLRHLLTNLFRNCIEHGPADVTITVGELDDGFYVADDGPGIPADERAAVQEAGHTRKDDGIGLGLTIVAQLTDLYDWEYDITESDDGGARFEFRGTTRPDEDAPDGSHATVHQQNE